MLSSISDDCESLHQLFSHVLLTMLVAGCVISTRNGDFVCFRIWTS